ncbi:MAG: hypothetical protein ACO3UT_02560 [Candidatus Nanopelagicaceae bacterium]
MKKANLERKELKVPREKKARVAQRVKPEQKAMQALKEKPELKGIRDSKVTKEIRVKKEIPEKQDQQVRQMLMLAQFHLQMHYKDRVGPRNHPRILEI